MAHQERIDSGGLSRHENRDAEGAERDGGGIRDQAQAGRVQRIEPEGREDRGSDGNGRAEACCAFQEGTEREADQDHLQPLVFGDRHHRGANHFELSRFDGQLVEKDRAQDDPRDRPQAVRHSHAGRAHGESDRHAIDDDRDDKRNDDRTQAGEISLPAEHRERDEEESDRQRCDQCGQPECAERVIDLRPGFHISSS